MIKYSTPDSAEVITYEFEARRIWKTTGAELIRLVIPAGKCQELHDNPCDVIFYVLKGTGELLLENEATQLEAESCTEVKSGIERAWRNKGSKDLTLLGIKELDKTHR